MYTSASTLVTVVSFGLLARALPTARSRNEVPITFYAAGGVQLTQSFSTDGAPVAINNGLSISRISSSTPDVTCVFSGIDHSSTTVPGAAVVDVGPPQAQTQGYCFVSYASSSTPASSWVPSPSATPPTLIQPDDAWTIWAQPTETPSVSRRSRQDLPVPGQGSGDAPELAVEDPPTFAQEPEEPSTTTPSSEEITSPPPSSQGPVVTDPLPGDSTAPLTSSCSTTPSPVVTCTTTPSPISSSTMTPCHECESTTTPSVGTSCTTTPSPVTSCTTTPSPVTSCTTTPSPVVSPTTTPCNECESTPAPCVDCEPTPTPCKTCKTTPPPCSENPCVNTTCSDDTCHKKPCPAKPCPDGNCPDDNCPEGPCTDPSPTPVECPDDGCHEDPCPDEKCYDHNKRPSYTPSEPSGDHIEITFNGEVNADFA
ncbi:hypothetical protein ASPACDRAFT_61366 [Aspergillus aculeatus ATCC 16872]|uniref:Uncharacterized protein n=1 Tax=Aspergillus aculeatus (strain ATCC 16872 / CBS 172.66 / WB 5094) TaxID=690307 RepID=A0A1L9WR25_ASPA1|nr:uncharacterized protein ASPACDRAFT_61366 [Aspergillus aculeatus ATCC 16872]OJJ98633.1 hypothetical protein ASPACDRAFT_61366 [Aspergillus aculeatus ATCC 16872]